MKNVTMNLLEMHG